MEVFVNRPLALKTQTAQPEQRVSADSVAPTVQSIFFAMHKVDHIERFAFLKYENRLEIVVNGIKYVSLCPYQI